MFTCFGGELFMCTCTELSMIIRTTCGICFTCEFSLRLTAKSRHRWNRELQICIELNKNDQLPRRVKALNFVLMEIPLVITYFTEQSLSHAFPPMSDNYLCFEEVYIFLMAFSLKNMQCACMCDIKHSSNKQPIYLSIMLYYSPGPNIKIQTAYLCWL